MSTQVTYLPGPTVCGLFGAFENDFGDDLTPVPYCTISPSRLGSGELLPFKCPACESAIDFTDPARRAAYHDSRPGHDNHWCPRCGNRFLLNLIGQQYEGQVRDGVAPATVECVETGPDGMTKYTRVVLGAYSILGELYIRGTDVLGCCA